MKPPKSTLMPILMAVAAASLGACKGEKGDPGPPGAPGPAGPSFIVANADGKVEMEVLYPDDNEAYHGLVFTSCAEPNGGGSVRTEMGAYAVIRDENQTPATVVQSGTMFSATGVNLGENHTKTRVTIEAKGPGRCTVWVGKPARGADPK